MIEPEELLQEKVEQLEAGKPLESCLAELPEREARILRLIATLRATPFPEPAEELIVNQRTEVLRAATKELTMKPMPASDLEETTTLPLLDRLRVQLDWLLSRRELATGLASVLVLVLLLAVAAGLARWWSDPAEQAIVQSEEPEAATIPQGAYPGPTTGHTPAAPPVVAGDPEIEESAGEATGPVVEPGYQLHLPLVPNPLVVNAQSAVVQVIEGIVEVQRGDGVWMVVSDVDTMTAGQRVRTGQLSSAILAFFDGSQSYLGPETEISIDQLDAQRPENGFRTVVMTQWLGESEHSVDFRNDQGSRYEVKTPAGSGLARGTKFRVQVTASVLVRFSVIEGLVDVNNASATVPVTAGQLTTIAAGQPPGEPAFLVTGEGELSQTGATWTIAGQTFQVNESTVITGRPRVGDIVRVEGHLLADGGRVADRISLLQRGANDRFQLVGTVETMGATAWTVAGQIITVNDSSRIGSNIAVGDRVRVDGAVLPDGSLLAGRIQRAEDPARPRFEMVGVVQEIGTEAWRISGQSIDVADSTAIGDGLAVGDVVAVRGRILEDGRWLASSIQRSEGSLGSFDFTGVVQSMDPWRVGGIAFATRPWTVIDVGVSVGDRVRVRGVILPDGTRVASSIALLGSSDDDGSRDHHIIIIVGTVTSVNPWIISGISLNIDNDTRFIGEITVNVRVQIKARLLADGRWRIIHVQAIHNNFGLGCLTISSVVTSVSVNQIGLRHWPAIARSDTVNVFGEVKVNSIVTFPVCTRFDGVIIITNVIVIYQQAVPPAPQPPRGGGNDNRSFRPRNPGNFNSNFNG